MVQEWEEKQFMDNLFIKVWSIVWGNVGEPTGYCDSHGRVLLWVWGSESLVLIILNFSRSSRSSFHLQD